MPLNFHFSSTTASVHQREMEVAVGWGDRQTGSDTGEGSQGAKRQVELKRPQKNSRCFCCRQLGGHPSQALPVDQSAGLGPAML